MNVSVRSSITPCLLFLLALLALCFAFAPIEVPPPKDNIADVLSRFQRVKLSRDFELKNFYIQKIEYVGKNELSVFNTSYDDLKAIRKPSLELRKFLNHEVNERFWLLTCYEKGDESHGKAFVFIDESFLRISSRE